MNGRLPIIPRDGRITAIDRLTATIRGSLIDGDLTNFPVGIEIPASSGFLYGKGATDWNYLHARSCGQECYIEVDQWDISQDTGILWIKVPAIRSGKDHQIELYFGADNTTTYVGETGDTAAQNVWDSNFQAVYHMSQDPTGGSGCILDSTSNGNHGTPGGSMTSSDLIASGFGKALDFDETDDYIGIPDSTSLSIISDFTLEGYCLSNGIAADNEPIVTKYFNSGSYLNSRSYALVQEAATGYAKSYISSNGTTSINAVGNAAFFGAYHHLVSVFQASTAISVYVDAVMQGTNTSSLPASIYDSSAPVCIGSWLDLSDDGMFFDGKISEIRISDTARSAAWLKASNAVLQKQLVSLR